MALMVTSILPMYSHVAVQQKQADDHVSYTVSGHLVSGYVKQHLPIILVNHLTSGKDVKKALTSGFLEVDKSLGNSRIDCEFSGSTAVVSYLKV